MRFSTTLAASLFSIALASPSPDKRADTLSVTVTGPSTNAVDSVDGLTLTAEVTNNGAEAIKLLKYGTILDDLPTRSFAVSKNGSTVPFTGVKLQVAVSNDNAYKTIQPGETLSVTHNVASLFDFASSGLGVFSFQPNTNFHIVGQEQDQASLADFTVSTQPIEVEITNNLVARNSAFKRATPTCTDSAQLDFITASYEESRELATLASEYISDNGASDDLFTAYFGSNSASAVLDVVNGVRNENDSGRVLSCEDELDVCDGNVIAYTVIATTDIYYCNIFFDEVDNQALCGGTTVNSRNIRGGTTLHELTHAVSDTDDVNYGCPTNQQLSTSQKLINADNYNCFATQVYADTQC
ncbi:hypothetical protein VNI00_014781 [Paramarasmius palmivorus]|uniref:Neutral protease 2 n=1 Tax=Paramarasmius palmivorus TaxID=297713 RepID=A0AAW0BU11_9AGAR